MSGAGLNEMGLTPTEVVKRAFELPEIKVVEGDGTEHDLTAMAQGAALAFERARRLEAGTSTDWTDLPTVVCHLSVLADDLADYVRMHTRGARA
jgi:hypothetical protein